MVLIRTKIFLVFCYVVNFIIMSHLHTIIEPNFAKLCLKNINTGFLCIDKFRMSEILEIKTFIIFQRLANEI